MMRLKTNKQKLNKDIADLKDKEAGGNNKRKKRQAD